MPRQGLRPSVQVLWHLPTISRPDTKQRKGQGELLQRWAYASTSMAIEDINVYTDPGLIEAQLPKHAESARED